MKEELIKLPDLSKEVEMTLKLTLADAVMAAKPEEIDPIIEELDSFQKDMEAWSKKIMAIKEYLVATKDEEDSFINKATSFLR